MHNSNILINASDISKSYNNCQVLQNISLTVKENEMVTIIGPNGGGKTTLLRILLRLIKQDSGKVIHTPNLIIGYVPQNLDIIENMAISVRKTIKLITGIDSYDNPFIKDLEVHKILDSQLYDISCGELQRVLLVCALMKNPNLLILDEPVQSIDIMGQVSFYKLLEDIKKQTKIAMLMVSHDLHFVLKSSDHVICLYHHICCAGSPNNVERNPEYIKLFGKEALSTMGLYVHHHDHDHEHNESDKH